MDADSMFSVGNVIAMQRGKCTVVSASEGSVRLRDEAGVEFDLPVTAKAIAAKAKAERKSRKEGVEQNRDIDPRLLDPAVIGFLSARGTFMARVKLDKLQRFYDKYESSEPPKPSEADCGPSKPPEANDKYVTTKTDKKWGTELRISMRATEDELKVLGISDLAIDATLGDGRLEINCNKYWWRLNEMGFKLGADHDLVAIRREMAAHLDEFERGRGVIPVAA